MGSLVPAAFTDGVSSSTVAFEGQSSLRATFDSFNWGITEQNFTRRREFLSRMSARGPTDRHLLPLSPSAAPVKEVCETKQSRPHTLVGEWAYWRNIPPLPEKSFLNKQLSFTFLYYSPTPRSWNSPTLCNWFWRAPRIQADNCEAWQSFFFFTLNKVLPKV